MTTDDPDFSLLLEKSAVEESLTFSGSLYEYTIYMQSVEFISTEYPQDIPCRGTETKVVELLSY